MTHDELLAKVSNYKDAGLGSLVALRAVVELHKPMDICRNLCSGCYEEEGGPNPYPCPTIQAIEKELG
jgi:hypothetical protein